VNLHRSQHPPPVRGEALTEADVRRIVREEVAEALAEFSRTLMRRLAERVNVR
jgi:hypothetical protein